jgi:NADH-quinone oxidoreductase subunit A
MNALFFLEYNIILIYLTIALLFALAFVVISYLFAVQVGGTEKLSAYECGFEPFEDARNTFNISTIIFAIMFIVFDIEALYLLPWTVMLPYIGSFGFWIVIDFFIELIIGYFYVWKKGAFDTI